CCHVRGAPHGGNGSQSPPTSECCAALYRLQRQTTPGQYPGLGALLGMLEAERHLDDTWFRYLHTVLTNPAGWNIRNEMSHGFLEGIDARHSALLLNCAARLAILPLLLEARASRGIPEPEPEPGE